MVRAVVLSAYAGPAFYLGCLPNVSRAGFLSEMPHIEVLIATQMLARDMGIRVYGHADFSGLERIWPILCDVMPSFSPISL